jgi:putative ABC transport system permease protein
MLDDLRYALRTLRRSPGFVASAILALALGIGANTAVFSVVYAVLLKPLPFDQPERLVRLYEQNSAQGIQSEAVSIGTFADWRGRARTLESVAAYYVPFNGETLWTIGDRVQVVKTAAVSPALFTLLHVRPLIGHVFRSDQEQPPPGAPGQFTISYGFWQRAFGGSPDVVGRQIMLEGRLPREIVGVMPRGFAFPDGVDAWTSLPIGVVPVAQRRARSYAVVARMTPNVTMADVRRELAAISTTLESEQPASNRGWSPRAEPLAGSDTGTARLGLFALMAAVSGVLLIGCANVANLLFARALSRRREMAVRLALGAGTARLVRQCLTEAALLCAGGVIAGVVFGGWLAGLLVSLAPPDIPRLNEVGLNAVVLLFAACAGVVGAASTGVAPALQAVRAERDAGLRSDMRSATERGAGMRRWLIAGEVMIVVLLLTGALLFLRTFVKLRAVELGFQTEHVMVVETRWPVGRLFQSAPGTRPWPRIQRAVDRLVAIASGVPGVESAGLVTEVPLTGDAVSGTVWRADAPGAHDVTPPADARDRWKADVGLVTAGYFPSMGLTFLRGRNFDAADRFSDEQLNDASVPRAGVAVVNAAFASRYFPGEDPVGRTIVLPDAQTFGAARTIIGVVSDVRGHTVAEAPRPGVLIPHEQNPDVLRPSLVLRSSLPFEATAAVVRQRIAEFDPQLLVLRIRPMDEIVSGALSRPRFNLLLLASFATVALLLAAIGIYGVLAYLVTQRTREIGIRMALGARAADVLRLVLREGMTPVVLGAGAGMVGALAGTRAIGSLLFGVTPLDPVSFAIAPALLATVALLACYLPARRATRVDPLVALRDE